MFLGHSRGSIGEIQTQLVIAKAIGLASPQSLEEVESLSAEVGKMLVVMMRKLKS